MKLTIIRGLPGTGKSTLARELAEKTGAIVIEPDQLLIENGEYHYSPERYALAVERCMMMIELLNSRDYDSKRARLRPDIIYTDVLPRVEDINRVLLHVDYSGTLQILTAMDLPDLRRCSNAHAVDPRDLWRMVRIFEVFEGEDARKLRAAGRMFHGHYGQYGLHGLDDTVQEGER